MNTYYLSEQFRYIPKEGEGGYWVGQKTVDRIESPVSGYILELIQQGVQAEDSLLQKVGQRFSPVEAMIGIQSLHRDAMITINPPYFGLGQAQYWRLKGFDPDRLSVLLRSFTIEIRNLSSENDGVIREFESAGFVISNRPKIVLALATDYLSPELAELDAECKSRGLPWMLIRTSGEKPLVGPLFHPIHDNGPCWHCLAQRLRLHHQPLQYLEAIAGIKYVRLPEVCHPLGRRLAISVAIHILINWLNDQAFPEICNGLIELCPETGQQDFHRLFRRPQCPGCGTVEAPMPRPIRISKEQNVVATAGGFRTVPHSETFERYVSHVSSITGVIPYLRPYAAADDSDIFNYSSGPNLALFCKSVFWANLHFRAVNGGKGKTELQAKTGAICEAIERYSCTFQGNIFSIKGKFSRDRKCSPPQRRYVIQRASIFASKQANESTARFHSWVPVRFDPEKEFEWVPVYNLSREIFEYLPAFYCYAQYPSDDELNQFAYPDSNGCAAGNTFEEAILQGLLELIERDAAAIWWYNRIRRPGVALATISNDYIQRMGEYYLSVGRNLFLLDITTDLGIPVFASVSSLIRGDETDEIIFAFGAHLDPAIAIERAVIELNQLLPLAEKTNGQYTTKDPDFLAWLSSAKLADHSYLCPVEEMKMKANYPHALNGSPSVSEGIERCMDALHKAGLEVLVLNHTQPDIELPVARVIAPGLRHFWRRTGPGRMFDVPVKMGWNVEPLQESELNPISIFI